MPALFTVATFLSAFLLFAVQPMIAKRILPWFGGSSSVWTICMLFFTVALLAGYAYAHLLATRNGARRQAIIHLVLLAACSAILLALFWRWDAPIMPGFSWQPSGNANPVTSLLILLAASIGLPYFLLSSTSTLLQSWASSVTRVSPYRLYVVSNAGSFLALLSYPFLIEPFLPLRAQGIAWSVGFVVCAAMIAACAWRFLSSHATPTHAVEEQPSPRIGARRLILWTLLALLPSALLLAATNQITKGIAPVPFLWILPLGIYLISFILCFTDAFTIPTDLAAIAFALIAPLAFVSWFQVNTPMALQLLTQCLALFFLCMTCHGELYKRRPEGGGLTSFYLCVSAGGALGAVAVALVAPVIFTSYFELPFALAAGLITAGWILRQKARHASYAIDRSVAVALMVLAVAMVMFPILFKESNILEQRRDFYGVLRVMSSTSHGERMIMLHNGNILHGLQFASGKLRTLPTTYYTESSGMGLAINGHPKRETTSMHVGIVGLGAGTSVAYCRPGDDYRAYEINRAVVDVAKTRFDYLARCDGSTVVLGDARLSLEAEAKDGGLAPFDVLAIDAFSDDSIPVHLITNEAVAVYLKRLATDGILAFHISNRYLDLAPVLKQLADSYGLTGVIVADDGRSFPERAVSSVWVLLSRDKDILDQPGIASRGTSLSTARDLRPWTDDFSNLYSVLR